MRRATSPNSVWLRLANILTAHGYGQAFRQDHLYPMAAAVWSLPAKKVADYPAAAFVTFCQNHGLLKITDRPNWRTVDGGAKIYVEALCAPFKDKLRLGVPVRSIRRRPDGVFIRPSDGPEESSIRSSSPPMPTKLWRCSAIRRRESAEFWARFAIAATRRSCTAIPRLMPRRRKVWSSWNYMAKRFDPAAPVSVTYWMNRLQNIPEAIPRFVTLNPIVAPREESGD